MIKKQYLFTCLLILVGCGSVNYTYDERFSGFLKKCFELKQDSFLYSLKYCYSGSKSCAGIQVFDYDENEYLLPENYKKLGNEEEYWTSQITFRSGIGGIDNVTLLGELKAGQQIKVQDITLVQNGSNGSFWVVQFKVDNDLKNLNIVAPNFRYLKAPSWLKSSGLCAGPVWDPEFVTECNL